MLLSRRKFFIGAAAAVATPAIIRVINLMPIRPAPITVLPDPIWSPYSRSPGQLILTRDISPFKYYDEALAESRKLESKIIRDLYEANRLWLKENPRS